MFENLFIPLVTIIVILNWFYIEFIYYYLLGIAQIVRSFFYINHLLTRLLSITKSVPYIKYASSSLDRALPSGGKGGRFDPYLACKSTKQKNLLLIRHMEYKVLFFYKKLCFYKNRGA